MEQNNKNASPSIFSVIAGSIIAFTSIVSAHLLVTFLFWLCLNPTLKAFGLKAIGFGTCFGIWSAWLMALVVPALVILNVVKSMWPTEGDLLVKMLSSHKKDGQL